MMKFYRENKVNPFASCLPLVAQLPVFLALFYMLQDDLRLDVCPDVNPAGTEDPRPCGSGGAAEFLFIPDLTDNATGGVLIALIVLYVGSQLLSTILMSTATDKTQRIIFLALPFVFVIFVINFPAGLLVYWITTNLWTIVQQAIVRKRLGPMRPPTPRTRSRPMSIMDRMLHRGGGGAVPAGQRSRVAALPAEVAGAGGRAPVQARVLRRARRLRRHDLHARRRSAPGGADERPQRATGDRVRELLEHVNEALGWRRRSRWSSRTSDPRRPPWRRHGPVHRRHGQTIDAVQHSGVQGGGPRAVARAQGSRSMRPATATVAGRRWSARPTKRRPTRSARSARWRSTR
jgi:YidC/Oxa1 family membrane protein insertase